MTLEKVVFARDEMANMAWAVEAIVPSALGAGADGYSVANETAPPVAVPPPLPEGVEARYELGSDVPWNWRPFVPVHIEGSVAFDPASPLRDCPRPTGRSAAASSTSPSPTTSTRRKCRAPAPRSASASSGRAGTAGRCISGSVAARRPAAARARAGSPSIKSKACCRDAAGDARRFIELKRFVKRAAPASASSLHRFNTRQRRTGWLAT